LAGEPTDSSFGREDHISGLHSRDRAQKDIEREKFHRREVLANHSLSHTVEVTATTLYEAIALGLVALRENDWVAGIPEGLAAVRVSVTQIPIEHTVKMRDFTSWVRSSISSSCRNTPSNWARIRPPGCRGFTARHWGSLAPE
jgi:hypothetical protein